MILTRVTFTGADESTDLARLARIAAAHPYVEFAVLLSTQRAGMDQRYPRKPWRERFYRSDIPRAQRALHLCGTAVERFLNGHDPMLDEIQQVARVQLNFRADKLPISTLRRIPSVIDTGEARGAWPEIILQHNEANAELPELLTDERVCSSRVSFLADASGGRGITPACWPAPVPGYTTAYAGGLGPGRLVAALHALAQVTPCTGIDMETHVRTEGRFDLNKVEQVLQELAGISTRVSASRGAPVLQIDPAAISAAA